MKSGLQKHKILAMASNLLAKVFVSVSKKALLKVPQHLIVFFSFVVSLSLSLSVAQSLFALVERSALSWCTTMRPNVHFIWVKHMKRPMSTVRATDSGVEPYSLLLVALCS